MTRIHRLYVTKAIGILKEKGINVLNFSNEEVEVDVDGEKKKFKIDFTKEMDNMLLTYGMNTEGVANIIAGYVTKKLEIIKKKKKTSK